MPKLSELSGTTNYSKIPAHDVPNGHVAEREPQLPAIIPTTAAKTVKWTEPVICIGTGSVWECSFPLLIKHLNLKFDQITLIDMLDRREVLKNWIDKGVEFVQKQILPENFEAVMKKYVPNGSLVIDLAYDIDIIEILDWCREHDCLYINTSIEQWDYKEGDELYKKTAWEKSLHYRRVEVDVIFDDYKDGPSAAIDCGANPGLISHFMKQGLLDLAKSKGKELKTGYADLAKDLGVKVVLDTERDTQRCIETRKPGEFVNTWSCMGFLEEGTAPAELGWGTHEKEMPLDASEPEEEPMNQIFLHTMGINTRVRGMVPADPKAEKVEKGEKGTFDYSSNSRAQQISGMLVRHGEAYTISKFLTTKDGKYRPTVYYCYQPCDSAVSSLQEFRGNDYKCLPHQRIIYDNDIIDGSDCLGIMIGGYDDKHVWWTGSCLNIDEARELMPLQNATSIQVAMGVVSAIMYIVENPNMGVLNPEDIPTDYVLKIAKPYLGTFISKEYEWTPLKDHTCYFPENDYTDSKNLWSFENFWDQN